MKVREDIIKVITLYNEMGSTMKINRIWRFDYKEQWQSYPVRFFDGAGKRRQCGCGEVIVMGPGRY